MIGRPAFSPSMSRSTCSESGNPPFSTMPEIDGNVADACAVSTPSSTSLRSPGTTTTEPSMRRVQHVLHRHRGDHHAERLAVEQVGVAGVQLAVDGLHDRAHRRRDEERVLGDRPHGDGCRGARLAAGDRVDVRARAPAPTTSTISASRSGSARFTTTPSSVACSRSSSSSASSVSWASSSGVRASAWPRRSERAAPLALADPAAEHEQHGRAEVRGDAGVVGELGRGCRHP